MFNFLWKNRDWIFAGIGLYLLGLIISISKAAYRRYKQKRESAKNPPRSQELEIKPEPTVIPQDVKPKKLLTPEGKEAITRALRDHWPLFPLAVAIFNYIREPLGANMKGEFLFVSLLYAVSHYLILNLKLKRKNFKSYSTLHRYLSLVTIVILIPLFIKSVITFYNSSTELGNFEYRIDNILEHQYRVYNSRIIPEWAYKFLKKKFHLPYYPELYDQIRHYDSIKICCYHLDSIGIIKHEYQGKSYSGDSTRFCSINYGEVDSISANKHLTCLSLSDGQEIEPNKQEFLPNYKGSSIFSSYIIPGDFHFVRCFCAPGSMTKGSKKNEYEGFVIDLRHITHPPPTIDIDFVTDRQISNVNIFSLERRHSLVDWQLARPFYPQDESALIDDLHEINDTVQLDSIATDLKRPKHTYYSKKLALFRYTLKSSGKPQIFLLRYMVKGPIHIAR